MGVAQLIRAFGFAESVGQARRLIGQGAVKIDFITVTDIGTQVPLLDETVVSVGNTRRGHIRARGIKFEVDLDVAEKEPA